MSLYEETLKRLNQTGIHFKDIRAATGITERWLYTVLSGDIADPGVKKIEILNEYLKRNRKRK